MYQHFTKKNNTKIDTKIDTPVTQQNQTLVLKKIIAKTKIMSYICQVRNLLTDYNLGEQEPRKRLSK